MGTTTGEATGSVERVRAALRAAGHADAVQEFPDGTKTAADAAAAIGCTVAQIAKSVIFRGGETPVLVIASGANQVDTGKVAALTGLPIGRADGAWVRATTGFAIGGVAPLGHATPPVVLVDEDLFALDPVWAAAGSPRHVFRTTAADLLLISGGRRAEVAARG
ncbi:YbaK/EbsC family protein [Roseomonas sp. CCTCC AB2023176]|uniref:YbaK/EbsC family protein n=1 Tax=Roseomonas sp. CCTCC AB2023176 TaxID=3342640 RepID=UPI0035DCAD49